MAKEHNQLSCPNNVLVAGKVSLQSVPTVAAGNSRAVNAVGMNNLAVKGAFVGRYLATIIF